MNQHDTVTGSVPVGMKRRLGAIFYDTLLVFSVLFFGTFPLLAITGGQAIEPDDPWFSAYVFALAWFYFAWQWRHGYTLGMKAWRIKIETTAGRRVSWVQTVIRFAVSIASWLLLGAGFLFALFDKQQRAWHDRLSSTRLVLRDMRPE